MRRPRTSAVVLCGGSSRRMGRDKASLPIGAETLLSRTVRVVSSVADDVVLAARAGQDVPEGVPVVRDPAPDQGPLVALLGALTHVRHDRMLVTACDAPLLQPAVVRHLVDLAGNWEAVVPTMDGILLGTLAVYRTAAVRREAPGLAGNPRAGLRDLIARLRCLLVEVSGLRTVDPDLLSFLPCNTPEEYDRVLRLAAREPGRVNGP